MIEIRKALGILALGALLLPAGVVAQDVLLGVKGGINSANISISDFDEDTSAKTGLVAGIFAEFGISDMFAIRPEGLYSSKGFKSMEGTTELEFEANYIEIPVLLVAHLGTSSFRPLLFAGPVLSFESKCNISGSDAGVTIDVACSDFPGEAIDTKNTDFGAAFGAGFEADLGSAVLLVDGRYTLGLTNLDASSTSTGSAKNRVWSFMAGLGFEIG